MTKTTVVYALPYPEETDAADVPRDVQALAQRLDTILPSIANMAVSTKGASYVLVLNDANSVVEMNVAGANTVTVPPSSAVAFAIGSVVTIAQLGVGQTALVAGAGVTLRAYNGNLKIAGQYGVAAVIKRAADEWWAAGNLVP
jgi:hypothetical protein